MTSRVDVLKAQGFNSRVIALANETEAHSDDELEDSDGDGPVYHIKEKEGRSEKVKAFFRMADKQRQRMARAKRRHTKLITYRISSMHWLIIIVHRTERRREEPPMPKQSNLTAQPKQVPIDWFEPTYWNTYLTVRERASYIQDGIVVALPLPEFCGTWELCASWKNLPKKEFMVTYGNAVLKKYNLPTEEELEQLENYSDEEEDEEDEEGDDENGDESD